MWVFDAISYWFSNGVEHSWRWICSLNTQEWFLLLGITAAAGFMCMRGFGSQSSR